jgi:hypothetical protein
VILDSWLRVLVATILIGWATGRATRLVTADDFPPIFTLRQKIRYARPPITRRHKTWNGSSWVHDSKQDDPDYWWFGELVSCLWCASFYISAAITAVTWAWYTQVQDGSFPAPVLVWAGAWWLAASGLKKIN